MAGFDQAVVMPSHEAAKPVVPSAPGVYEVRYVAGRHGAALVEDQWGRIAEFIVNDVIPTPPDDDYVARAQPSIWRVIRKMSPMLLLLIIALVIAPIFFLPAIAAFLYIADHWFCHY